MLWTSLFTIALWSAGAAANLSTEASAQVPGNTGLEGCGSNAEIVPVNATIKPFPGGKTTRVRLFLALNLTREFTEGKGYITVTNSRTFEQVEESEFDLCARYGPNRKCPIPAGFHRGVITFNPNSTELQNFDVNVDIFAGGKQELCLYGGVTGFKKDPRRGDPPSITDDQQILEDIRWEM